jgi:NADH:ubiquinone oxidoreductase subunit 2 (subunit N)
MPRRSAQQRADRRQVDQRRAVNTPPVVAPGILSKIAIALCAAITVILGIFPQPLLDLADRTAQLLQ